jgi:rod shape-determining protein MreD
MRDADGYLAVSFWLFVAMVLTVIPLPESSALWRPAWLPLAMIYWVVALPHRVGVITGFFAGLLLDNLEGGILGQNALALSVLAWVAYALHNRLRVYAVWQQSLTVMIIVGIFQLINLLVERAVSTAPWSMSFWLPSATAGILWPWVVLIMGSLRGRRS